jgi:hypothetical protein
MTALEMTAATATCPTFFAETERLSRIAMEHQEEFVAYRNAFNEHLQGIDPDFFAHWDVSPCPLVPRLSELRRLEGKCRHLFTIVEKTVQTYMNGNPDLLDLFSRYVMFRPMMERRFLSWQEYGRYDYIINTKGEPFFIELNSAMASGNLPMDHVNNYYVDTAPDWLRPEGPSCCDADDRYSAFANHLLHMESVANSGDGVIAILVDENKKYHEADMIKASLEAKGREVIIAQCQEMRKVGRNYEIDGKRVTTTYNKFRLSGADDHWDSDSASKYHIFLNGVREKAFLCINNFAAMTVSENKGIFAAMRTPSVASGFTEEELAFIENHTPGTWIFKEGTVDMHGVDKELVAHVKENRGEFVLKPCDDYRGSGVYSGREHDQDEWNSIVDDALGNGYLVQDRVDAQFFEVTHVLDGEIVHEEVSMAGGVYMNDMSFHGMVARVANSEVINAIRHAVVLPIQVIDDCGDAGDPALS